MPPGKKHFKNPHIEEKTIGKFPVAFYYKIPKEIPQTAVAFSELAKIEYRDQMAQRDGHDNHVASLQKLMDAFDVFIREKSGGKLTAGKLQHDFSKNEDFTISLLWQIRHILTHNGGMVDKKSKKKYEVIVQNHKDRRALVDLPLKLELDRQFTIDHQNYMKARECILNYIQKEVSPDDFWIIKCRGFLVIHQPEGSVIMFFRGGYLILDIEEATMHGFTINSEIIPPENTTINLEEQRVYLADGTSFPVKFIP